MQIQQILIHIHPDYVFPPDAVYAMDWHRDHIATARNVLFALKTLPLDALPKRFFTFQSWRSSYKFPFQSWHAVEWALNAHSSQITPFTNRLMIGALRLLYFPWQRNRASVHPVSLRELRSIPPRFESHTQLFDKMAYGLFNHILGVVMQMGGDVYLPPPMILGLNLHPSTEISFINYEK